MEKVSLVVRGTLVDEGSKVSDPEGDWDEWVCLEDVSISSWKNLSNDKEKERLGKSGCDNHGRFIVRNRLDALSTLTLEFERQNFTRKLVEFSVSAGAASQSADLFIELCPLNP